MVPSTSDAFKVNVEPSLIFSSVVSATAGGSFTAIMVKLIVAGEDKLFSLFPSFAWYVKLSDPL